MMDREILDKHIDLENSCLTKEGSHGNVIQILLCNAGCVMLHLYRG